MFELLPLESLQFDSFADFMAMGGHGVFVWSVYAATAVVLISLALAPLRKKRRFFIEQAMILRRQQAQRELNK